MSNVSILGKLYQSYSSFAFPVPYITAEAGADLDALLKNPVVAAPTHQFPDHV